MNAINERFRKIREELEQTQEDFAQKASRTRSEIKNIEYGKTTPKPEVIKAICSAWGICEEWLSTGNGPKMQSRSRQEEITSFVNNAMSGANKTDTQHILTALMDATPDEIEAIARFALRIAEQATGIQYELRKNAESSVPEHPLPVHTDRFHRQAILSSPITVPGADGPIEISQPDAEPENTP